jgi:hypothetical protein
MPLSPEDDTLLGTESPTAAADGQPVEVTVSTAGETVVVRATLPAV